MHGKLFFFLFFFFSFCSFFKIILLNVLDLELNWQATFEAANLLACNYIKWSFGTGNQFHFYVVSSSNWGYNIQVR
jgi:hypothetical protein